MLAQDSIDAAALRLLEARRTGRPLQRLEPPDLGDAATAYAIQSRVMRELGPVGAFKTGRKHAGETPIFAPILAATVRPGPARFRRDELRLVGIELEIGFRIDETLPSPADPEFAGKVRERVSPCATIEVVDSRLGDPDTADALWKLADNQINGGLVVGPTIASAAATPLIRRHARLEVDGETVFDADADVPGGDAFDTFVACARAIGDHCGGLKAGQFVTTGSLTGLRYIDFGASVRGVVDGFVPIAVTFR